MNKQSMINRRDVHPTTESLRLTSSRTFCCAESLWICSCEWVCDEESPHGARCADDACSVPWTIFVLPLAREPARQRCRNRVLESDIRRCIWRESPEWECTMFTYDIASRCVFWRNFRLDHDVVCILQYNDASGTHADQSAHEKTKTKTKRI